MNNQQRVFEASRKFRRECNQRRGGHRWVQYATAWYCNDCGQKGMEE